MKPARSVSPLEAHLGYWLRFVSNHVSHAFSLKVAERGVTVAEWVMLREMYASGAIAPSALADRLGMTRGAISKLADRLAEKDFVRREAQKEDRRFQTLALTTRGRALVPVLSALADRNDEEFFGHLDGAVRETIEAAMKEIVRRLELRSLPVD